jgi:hypothetical protein
MAPNAQGRARALADTLPIGLIVLARWRRDRRAVNGISIEASPFGKMHHAVIRLVDSQTGRLLDVACHARVVDAALLCFEGTDYADGS